MVDKPHSESEENLAQGQDGRLEFTNVWGVLLVVYLILFSATAYLAFLNVETVKPEDYQKYELIQDSDIKKVAIKILEVEDKERSKRHLLATQSFYVVLGALLGFLSASVAPLLRRKKEAKN